MIRVYTTFDIVATGNPITDSYSRKNWNTLQQIINLRCQIEIVNQPYITPDIISCFDFNSLSPSVYANISDPLHYLKADSTGVPMLKSDPNNPDMFVVEKLDAISDNRNIWFEIINR
jgi:hypothetical protein